MPGIMPRITPFRREGSRISLSAASLFSIFLGVIAHAKADPWIHTTAAPPSPPEVVKQCGIASWYGHRWQGRRTASGARFDDRKFTAANTSLPFKTKARVTNLANGRSIEVVVNDRGPYIAGRMIDLSAGAARALGMLKIGLADVAISAELAPEGVITR